MIAALARRPVGVVMVAAAVAVFGVLSLRQLPVDFLPAIAYPAITVRARFPGAAPPEVEQQVTRPIEEVLATVEGLVAMRAVSRPETSEVVLELDWAADVDAAVQEVREKLDLVPFEPGEVERPVILRYDPEEEPVIRVGLVGAGDAFALREFAEESLRRHIESRPGVAAARVRGGQVREVLVALDEGRLAQHGLSAAEVMRRLGAESVNIPGGRLTEGEVHYLVRTVGELRTAEDVGAVVVARAGEASVRLRDVARVAVAAAEPTMLVRIDGRPGVVIDVHREAAANLVAVADAVRETVAPLHDEAGAPSGTRGELRPRERRLRSAMPPGTRAVILGDRAAFIRAAIDEVLSTLLWGGIVTVLCIYLMLGTVRPTVVISISIPLSLFFTFALMRIFDISLNLMSIGGLVVGVGMWVDNSIVVMEAIQRRREEAGDGLLDAAIHGAHEVAAPVIASTLTSVCVFLPVVFVTGVAGQLFRDLAFAVVFSLLASLVVALTFVPMAAARGFDAAPGGSAAGAVAPPPPGSPLPVARLAAAALRLGLRTATRAGRSLATAAAALFLPLRLAARVTCALMAHMETAYPRRLARALRRPVAVVLVAFAATGLATAAVWPHIGARLIPAVNLGEATARLELAPGAPLADTAAAAAAIEGALANVATVRSVLTVVGGDATTDLGTTGTHAATVTVQVTPGHGVAARERDVTATLLRAAGDLPGARAGLVPPTLFTFRTPIEVDVWGEDLAQTRRFADGLVAALATRPRLTAVRAVMAPPLPEVRVRYDRDRLARHGLTVDDVAREVRDKLEGRVPARLAVQREGERLDIRVRVAPGDVAGVADLKRLAIARGAGGTPAVMNMTMNMVTSTPAAETRGTRPSDGPATVALGTVADIEVVDGPSEIHHVAGRRAVRVTADVGGLDLRGAADDVRGVLAGLTRPADVDVTLSGQSEEMDASLAGLVLALLLAAFLVYVIMAATFESFRAPLCIMFTVPLGVAGALMGLWASGEPLSVVAAVGVITLTGVVVNNAIVLLDCAGRLHHGGLDVDAALVEAARVRLRPILITTATTVLGLVPMAMPGAEGAEIRVPVAVTLIGGLMLSTFLTLFVIPAAWRLAVAPTRRTKPPI